MQCLIFSTPYTFQISFISFNYQLLIENEWHLNFFFFFFEKAHLKVETKSKLQVVSGYDRVTQRAQRSPDHTHTDSPHNFLHPRRTWITEAQKLLEAFFFKKYKKLYQKLVYLITIQYVQFGPDPQSLQNNIHYESDVTLTHQREDLSYQQVEVDDHLHVHLFPKL